MVISSSSCNNVWRHHHKYFCQILYFIPLKFNSSRSYIAFKVSNKDNFLKQASFFQSGKRFKHGSTFNHKDKNFNYCLELVKKSDYENYLATLLLPLSIQRAAFGLRACNIEMAQVQEVTSNKQIAQMRMQFWKEAIEQIYSDQPPHRPSAM